MLNILAALHRVISDFKAVEKKFEDQGIDLDTINVYIDDFKKLKDQNRIVSLDEKNIDYWGKKPWEEFKEFIDKLKTTKSKSAEKKLKKIEGAELYAENEDWYVYRILTLDASIMYGSGTKWCITQKDNTHFKNYASKHNIYFYISKYREDTDQYYKIAALIDKGGKVQYWDALDRPFNPHKEKDLELNLPTDNLENFEVTVIINGKEYKPKDIPDNIHVKHELDLTNTGIGKLPSGLVVTNILDASDNGIKKIPAVVVTGDGILHVNRNYSIDMEIDPDIDVKSLYMQKCSIHFLPKLNKNSREIEVDLSGSSIGGIDPDFEAYELDLSDCKIQHLPKLPNVKKLTLSGIKVDSMEIDPSTRFLDLSGMKLNKLPALHLQNFVCSNGTINKIDPNFKVDGELILSGTSIKKLPDNLTLKVLDLSESNLKELPKNLTVDVLILENSQIQTLAVEGLKAQSVYIAQSDITDIGDLTFDDIYHITGDNENVSITAMFRGSKLKKFPPLEKSRWIEGMDLSNSAFEQLPDELLINGNLILYNMPQLKKLPRKLIVRGKLSICKTGITKLPVNLKADVLIMDKNIDIPKTAKIGHVHVKGKGWTTLKTN